MNLNKIRKANYEKADFHYDVSKKQKRIIIKDIIEFIKSNV